MHGLKQFAAGGALALLATQVQAEHNYITNDGGYICPVQMSTQDMTSLEYGWVVQNFLYKYYVANGEFSASDFAKVPMSDMMASNGMTKAENLATNMNGLTTQAKLAVEGLQELGATQMDCDYSYPPSVQDDPMAFVVAAAYIEATLCGTFIGLADYVQQPTSAFLMARVAAEHGIHGSFLRSLMDPTPYSANSTSLTPAFTPEQALQRGSGEAVRDNVGNLGAFIPSSCVKFPQAPCGGDVTIGMINANLSNEGLSPLEPIGTVATSTVTGSLLSEPSTTVTISTMVGSFVSGTAATATAGSVYSFPPGAVASSTAGPYATSYGSFAGASTVYGSYATPSATAAGYGGAMGGPSSSAPGNTPSSSPIAYTGAGSKNGALTLLSAAVMAIAAYLV